MGRNDGGQQQDRDHGNKAKAWSKEVDKTENKINKANESGKSADEKLRDLLNGDS